MNVIPAKNERGTNDPRPSFVRVGVMILVALAASSAYLARHCIAVANTTIQDELAIDEYQMGWIFGAFSAGYFLCQIPGGWLGNRIGTRAALSSLSVLWSLLTVWTAAAASFVPLFCSRFAFGMAQAGLVPISARIVRDWIPDGRRGICSATIGAGMSVGGLITMGLTAWLMKHLHWRDIFYLYSLVGIIWAIVFYVWFRTRPEEHAWVNDGELDLIHDHSRSRPPGGTSNRHPQRDISHDEPTQTAGTLVNRMLGTRSVWAICSQSFFRAAGFGLFVSWFPAFLEYRYGLSPELAGSMTMYPLAGAIIGSLSGGVAVDLLLKRTGSKGISRCGVGIVALGLCALLTFASVWTASVRIFVMLMSLGAIFSGLGSPACWTASMDVGGRHTGVMMGAQNMAGTLGGFAMPIVLGYMIGDIRKTGGDWNLVVYLCSAIYLAGAICWLAVNPNQKID